MLIGGHKAIIAKQASLIRDACTLFTRNIYSGFCCLGFLLLFEISEKFLY